MALTYASWIHGHSVHAGVLPGTTLAPPLAEYFADGATFILSGPTVPGEIPYTFFFAIPTPVIVSDKRLHLESVMLKFNAENNKVFVTNVQVFDANTPLDVAGGSISMTGDHLERFLLIDANVSPPGILQRAIPEVFFGIGVSFEAHVPEDGQFSLQLYSAGADFYETQYVPDSRD